MLLLGETMSDEIELAVTPTEQVAEQVPETVEQVESEATSETVVETPEQAEEKAKKEPWFQKRIGELTKEKYESKREAEQARIETQQLRDYIESNQQGELGNAESRLARDAAIFREADKVIAERSFNESCNKVYATGKTEFPDFDQSVANLQMVGVSRDFLEIVTSSDAGHKVLNHLGNDLDEAARIAAMPPLQMARELTKLEFKLAQPAKKPVSKAPPPITPITASGTTEGPDPTDIGRWIAAENKRQFGR